jgi:hypothetical protein
MESTCWLEARVVAEILHLGHLDLSRATPYNKSESPRWSTLERQNLFFLNSRNSDVSLRKLRSAYS